MKGKNKNRVAFGASLILILFFLSHCDWEKVSKIGDYGLLYFKVPK